MSQEEERTGSSPGPAKRLFGALLIAAGFLIAGLSGLCSLGIFIASLASLRSSVLSFIGLLQTTLVIGGMPFAMGVGLILLGRAMRKES